MEKFTVCVISLFLGILNAMQAVKIRTFYVPGKAGNEAPLLCTYDLETDTLYDVKWYKDGAQFFRCEPNGVTTVYPVDGVRVQHVKFAPLGSCSLTLMMLTARTAGEYKCEVNTEGPMFEAASESKRMLVMEPPVARRRLQTANATATVTVTKANVDNSAIQYQHDHKQKDDHGPATAASASFASFNQFIILATMVLLY